MISKKNYIFSRSWVGPILSFFFIPVIWRNISSLTSLQYNKDHELAASINDNQHQFGVVEPPDGLTLGHSNKVGLGLPVHQPGFLSFCIFGVLKTALQVGNYCITINIQLESLPGKLIWSLYKSCWRWPSSARSEYSLIQKIQKVTGKRFGEEIPPNEFGTWVCTQT